MLELSPTNEVFRRYKINSKIRKKGKGHAQIWY